MERRSEAREAAGQMNTAPEQPEMTNADFFWDWDDK